MKKMQIIKKSWWLIIMPHIFHGLKYIFRFCMRKENFLKKQTMFWNRIVHQLLGMPFILRLNSGKHPKLWRFCVKGSTFQEKRRVRKLVYAGQLCCRRWYLKVSLNYVKFTGFWDAEWEMKIYKYIEKIVNLKQTHWWNSMFFDKYHDPNFCRLKSLTRISAVVHLYSML